MGVYLRAMSFCVLTIVVPVASVAQTIPIEKLNDWQFRFYVCKSVVMNAAIVTRMMKKHNISDQNGIDALQSNVGAGMANMVFENSGGFQFSLTEAEFISDLTFAVISGMVHGGFELSDMQLMSFGNEACINTIDGFVN